MLRRLAGLQKKRITVWSVCLASLAVVAIGVVVVVRVNQLRLQRRTAAEWQTLVALPRSPRPAPAALTLPPPVARYRLLAVGDRTPVRTLRMRHRGTFCTSPTSKPSAIQGTQIFTADPPGFVWTARIGMAPGLWMDAQDMLIAETGSMRVLLDATLPVVDAQGPPIDQGSALRLLAEMPWYPTALFDARYVTWSAIDANHARATLRLHDLQVSGVFEFGSDGLPLSMSAERYMGQSERKPWGGTYRDWRSVSGMRVPFEASVSWQLATGPFTYAHWLIESMTYDDVPQSQTSGSSS
ncbi:MAG: DUF6544 family protein [Pseudomonadota bacterium]